MVRRGRHKSLAALLTMSQPRRTISRALRQAQGGEQSRTTSDERSEERVEGFIMWYVYILKCKNDSYYVGSTDSVERRLKEHLAGIGGSYTKRYPPIGLIHREVFATKSAATSREKQLKRWSHEKKRALSMSNLGELCKLSTSHDEKVGIIYDRQVYTTGNRPNLDGRE